LFKKEDEKSGWVKDLKDLGKWEPIEVLLNLYSIKLLAKWRKLFNSEKLNKRSFI
jgi:hypothetical protein